MRKRLAIALVLVLALIPLGMAQAKTPLRGELTYTFAGHLGQFDSEGRLLGWQGTISGDINGVIKWWMVVPFKATGQASHFEDRFEIWNADETILLLAGEEAGTTTVRHGKNSNWRANGIVTEASPGFEEWIGRHVHEGGNFIWAAPGLPSHGWGAFRVN